MADGTVKAITLDKFLASQMTILEETDQPPHPEKVSYWNRIVNYAPAPEPDMYHFYSKESNKHVWSIHKDPKSALKGLRNRDSYKLLNDF